MDNDNAHKLKSHKIEGSDFKKVKAAKDNLERLRRETEKAHDNLWDTIKQIVPDANDMDKSHSLDVEFEEHGVYFVKETGNCGCGPDLADLIGIVPGKPGMGLMELIGKAREASRKKAG